MVYLTYILNSEYTRASMRSVYSSLPDLRLFLGPSVLPFSLLSTLYQLEALQRLAGDFLLLTRVILLNIIC